MRQHGHVGVKGLGWGLQYYKQRLEASRLLKSQDPKIRLLEQSKDLSPQDLRLETDTRKVRKEPRQPGSQEAGGLEDGETEVDFEVDFKADLEWIDARFGVDLGSI